MTSLVDRRAGRRGDGAGRGQRLEGEAAGWRPSPRATTGADGPFPWAAPGAPDASVADPADRRRRREATLSSSTPRGRPTATPTTAGARAATAGCSGRCEPLDGRAAREAETLCHLFTERPVYRPEEEVHIKGYLREREQRHADADRRRQGHARRRGPRRPGLALPGHPRPRRGSFYQRFRRRRSCRPASTRRDFEDAARSPLGEVTFRMEAYRHPGVRGPAPRPRPTPLDREFTIALTATYYAGGKVAGRPVRWRVTQFPYDWTPEGARGSSSPPTGASRATAASSRPRRSSAGRHRRRGGRRHARAQPGDRADGPAAHLRRRGDGHRRRRPDGHRDAQRHRPAAVRARPQGAALRRAAPSGVEPEVLVVGPDGKPLAGQPVTVRLLHRQWHSVLRASDFSDGMARYVTDVVDEKVSRADREERRRAARRCRSRCPAPASTSSSSRRATGSGARRPSRSTSTPAATSRWPGRSRSRGLRRHDRQGGVRRRARPRPSSSQSPFQNGARAGDRRGAGGQPVRVGRRCAAARDLRAADPADLRAAPAGALRADARAAPGHRAAARHRDRPRQARDDGRDGLAQGRARSTTAST